MTAEARRHAPEGAAGVPPQVDELIARWIDRLERAGSRERSSPSVRGPREALRDVVVRGSLVLIPGAVDTPVALVRAGERFAHRGTMALRGPCAPAAWVDALGLDSTRRAAVEFALTWFGAPFDGVNLGKAVLSWGVCHLSGDALAEALALARGSAPAAFAASLGRYGVDVHERAGAPALAVAGSSGAPLYGEAAAAAASADPRVVALLAWAARDVEARRAQLTVFGRRLLAPALAALGPAVAPRVLAAALALQLADPGALAPVARAAAARPDAVEAALRDHAEALERSGRAELGARIRRVLASPELDPAALLVCGTERAS